MKGGVEEGRAGRRKGKTARLAGRLTDLFSESVSVTESESVSDRLLDW
jgi:hypothetical protein